MADLAEFHALSRRVGRKHPCQINLVLPALTETEREQLTAALAADRFTISGGAISEWFARRDHKVSHQQVRAHRQGTCTCYVEP